jgi:hypothetical protein
LPRAKVHKQRASLLHARPPNPHRSPLAVTRRRLVDQSDIRLSFDFVCSREPPRAWLPILAGNTATSAPVARKDGLGLGSNRGTEGSQQSGHCRGDTTALSAHADPLPEIGQTTVCLKVIQSRAAKQPTGLNGWARSYVFLSDASIRRARSPAGRQAATARPSRRRPA